MDADSPHTAPAPRRLFTDDPAEMLAAARIALGRTPHDCLVLIGHHGHGSRPLITRSALAPLLTDAGPGQLATHLAAMRRHGCDRAFALIVLAEAYDAVPAQRIEEAIGCAGTVLFCAAAPARGDACEIAEVQVLGDGAVRRVRLRTVGAREWALAVSPPSRLRPFNETRSAAQAVLEGRPAWDQRHDTAAFETAGRELVLRPAEAGAADVGALFRRAGTALDRLPVSAADTGGEDFMTDCEHVAALLSALAREALHWELLALCVERGNRRTVDREQLLQQLTNDPGWVPHSDVCAGGKWYQALERLRVAAAAAMDRGGGGDRPSARDAWRGLTCVLVLLSWWNHRYASAGELVDELAHREPDSTLAPLLARIIDTPIPPAWWPVE